MDIIDCLGDAGPGASFEHAGRTWHMMPITQGVKAAVEGWLRKREWETVREMRDVLTEQQYIDLVSETRKKIAAGHFSFVGEYCRAQLDTVDGKLVLLKQCFARHHPDMTDEALLLLLAECPEKVEHAMASLHPREFAARGGPGAKKN